MQYVQVLGIEHIYVQQRQPGLRLCICLSEWGGGRDEQMETNVVIKPKRTIQMKARVLRTTNNRHQPVRSMYVRMYLTWHVCIFWNEEKEYRTRTERKRRGEGGGRGGLDLRPLQVLLLL